MDQFVKFISSLLNYDYSFVIFVLKVFAGVLIFWLVVGICYSVISTKRIYRIVRAKAGLRSHISASTLFADASQKNQEEWRRIRTRGASPDENERKLAIIAADTLVERILDLAGYHGEDGLGDKLKKIEPSDLESLQNAWEGHKVRNRIAHEAGYKLSLTDTDIALNNFEKVFKELKYI